jgi:hypothetical protein
VLYKTVQLHATPDSQISWWDNYEVIQCRGCDSISFRHVSGNSEDYEEGTGKYREEEKIFPSREAGRSPIEGCSSFPFTTRTIYSEVYAALNNNAPLLAAMGLRALIESVCKEQETTSKSLMGKINELADMGLLSKKQAEFLHAHRFMGNVAAHELKAPNQNELLAALDIAETLLKTIYILPHTVTTIRTGSNTAQNK